MTMERDKLISLVTKAQQGDQDALNDLFNAFYNDVYYFALKTVKDDQIACDVTQETFVEIINTLDKLQEPAAFVKWMKQITYHQCTRYFKKKKDVIVDEDEDGNTIFDTLAEENSEFIPDEALDKDEFKKTIMSMIDDLSEEQRAALMMFYYDELSIKQIAEIQGTNENTVKSRLNYAKKGIKKSVEDYEKKNGVKLHCVGVLPLLLWLFKDYFAQSVPASATVVAEGVATATGTAVTVTATATTTATVTTATTTAAVGVGAKIASLPIATKIIAGIVAATIAIGGVTTAVVLSNRDNDPSSDSSIVSGDNISSTDDQQNDELLDGHSFVPDYFKGLTYETALHQYANWLSSFELPYFNSTDEISVDNAFRFSYNYWRGYDQNGVPVLTTSIGYQKDLLKAIFGRDFDFTQLTSKYVVEVPSADTIIDSTKIEIVEDFLPPSNVSITMPANVKDNGDGTYSTMFLHTKVVDTLPEGREEGTYYNQPDSENNKMWYALHDHCVVLTIEQKDGFWVLKSYEGRPLSDWYAAEEAGHQDIPQYGQQEMDEAQKQKLLRLQVQRILTPLKIVGLPYFSSPDELSTERVCWFILNRIENREQYETSVGVWEIPVTEFDNLTEELFGQMYPYVELNSQPQGELYNVEYLAQQGEDMLRISVVGGAGGPEEPRATDYIRIDSDTYQVNFSWFVEDSDTPMNGYDETMVFKFVNDHWQIVSFSKK